MAERKTFLVRLDPAINDAYRPIALEAGVAGEGRRSQAGDEGTPPFYTGRKAFR